MVVRSTNWRRGWVIGGAAAVVVAAAGVGVAVASIPSSSTGAFTGCYGTATTTVELPEPVRVLDTRDGTGGVKGPIQTAVTVPVTAAIPAGALEALGNLTATEEQGVGFLTTWASGTMPTASSLNYVKDVDVANSVEIPLAADGTFQLYSLRTTHVVFDVTGYVRQVPGALRVIDPSAGQTCAADETQVTWSQQGPAGPAGPQGPEGVPGTTKTFTDEVTTTVTETVTTEPPPA